MKNCDNIKVPPSQTCQQHQNHWYTYAVRYGHQSLLGIRRLLRCTEEEWLPWLSNIDHQIQHHDIPATSNYQRNNYFTAPRFYCVETICASCGIVIAWTKFAKAESPTNI